MNFRIEEKSAFTIVGKGIRVSTNNGEQNIRIPKFWDESYENGFCQNLASKAGELGIIGACKDFDTSSGEFTYMIAAEKTDENASLNLEESEVPASTWAIFESIGPLPAAIQKVWHNIYSEWFPTSGYEHGVGPELEIYYPGNPSDEDYKSEVWIPVKKNRVGRQ
ncbi:GyrI-like domain-containing protein [Peribacillus alkalitolerans]|uniref:GyrI-like domain-containing protein n=1 Tax=Peribacillus alkalitolerans TaxID=1550385 RepID=UPI0013CFECB7|nr:GyrI-like domain-containing protein [Peribacillus alkalitolerans]